jgi:hypothetical protein
MSFTALLRPPMVWLVVAEVLLMVVLGSVAWHVWQQRIAPLGAVVSGPIASAPAPRPRPSGPFGTPSAPPAGAVPHPGPMPGLRTDADFLARQMAELNRVEVTFADLEWRVSSAIVDGIQHYLATVVLPSIERAEKGAR